MASFVLLLSLFFTHYQPRADHAADKAQSVVEHATYGQVPLLSQAPEPLAKFSTLFLSFSRLWSWAFALLSPQAVVFPSVYKPFFVQKINFIFVSTQAP